MTKIEPALTAEDWGFMAGALRRYTQGLHDAEADLDGLRVSRVADSIDDGQPFGFTWEDVRMLEAIVEAADSGEMVPTDMTQAGYDIIDRIAALLPPRKQP